MDASSSRDEVLRARRDGRDRGHCFLSAEDDGFTDRHVRIGGRELISFGSFSYLGLEFDPRLIEGAEEAYRRYGSQTSYSRGYLSCPLYRELEEDLLPRIFGVPHVLLLPSTSSTHHVMMPALLSEKDAVVSDGGIHRSVDDAITLQCARSNATRVVIEHGELEAALDVVAKLARTHEHVWFMCDGIHSMYGDALPSTFLRALLSLAPNVRLYVDDAHGMSWTGEHGRGHFLSRFPQDERVVVVSSLAMGFGTAGGVAVVRDPRLAELARLVGGPYSFSGPLRPGDLGASIASARIHLGPEIEQRQATLRRRVDRANELARKLGVPLAIENEVPIVFVALGRVEAAYRMSELLREAGFHVQVAGFPAVAPDRSGLRIAITAIHTDRDVDALFQCIASSLPRVLQTARSPRRSEPGEDLLEVATFSRIDDLDVERWDALVGPLSCVDARTMRAVERVFSSESARPEHRWVFRYVEVRDARGIAAMAPLATSLVKDDACSIAEACYLRPGAGRVAALSRLVEAGIREMRAHDCSRLVLRDVTPDPELAATLAGRGFVPVPGAESHVVNLDWRGEADHIARLPTAAQRKHVRSVAKQSALLDVEVWNDRTHVEDDVLERMHRMRASMARKNPRLDAFPVPAALLREQLASGSWEILVLEAKGRTTPVAWSASRHVGDDYRSLHCGVDYEALGPDAGTPYRQLVWQLICRAGALGCRRLHLAMGPVREKERLGAVPVESRTFVRREGAHRTSGVHEIALRPALARPHADATGREAASTRGTRR